MGANVGATRANDLPARRTSADKRLAIMPGGELIRTTLNAIQVTTDQKAGGSNPSERASIVSQDIVDVCLRTSWTGWQPLRLVVAGWVEGELAEQRPVAGEDADAEVGDQDGDFGSGVPSSDADVVELAAVAQGD